MREALNRLRDWIRRDTLAAEADEELRFHREMLARDHRALGASDADAQRAAGRQLGNFTRLREGLRDMWRIRWMDDLAQDLRYTLRGLAKQPGFTTAVVLTLALGLGANAAMFGVIDRLMFRPFAYLRDPSRVHRVYLEFLDRGKERISGGGYEYARYLDLRRGTTSFSQSAAFSTRAMAVGVGDAARERQVSTVSASFFDFFDALPAAGRYFTAAEDATPRGADVAVLSYAFWKTEFGGRDVLGQRLQVGNELCTIVGVAPEGFAGVNDEQPPAMYIPITAYAGAQQRRDAVTYYTTYHWGWLSMMVRRKPGIAIEQASADLSAAYVRSWNAERALEPAISPVDVARPQAVASAIRQGAGPDPGLDARTAVWVSGVAFIVFLIACANVANLLLARAFARRREIAIRLALGVARRRLIAQCLTESIALAMLGSTAGLLVAQWGGAAIRRLFIKDGGDVAVLTDWRTIVVALLLALVAGLLAGLVPAFLSGRGDLASTLKAGAREGTYHRSRARSALLVAQGALSVVLLVGAGVFVRSLNHVRAMRLGYDVDPVLLAVANRRGTPLNDSASMRLGQQLLERAQAIPGVEHAAWVSSIPFYSTSSTDLFVAGIDSTRRLGRFTYETTSIDYFKTMGTRIVRGRAFTPDDRRDAPRVAVVSETMAKTLWPASDAIGQCMRIGADTMPCTTVVGIAEDAAQNSLTDDKRLRYYLPIDQYGFASGFALLLRLGADPASQAEAVRKALQPVMPGQSYVTTQPLREIIDVQRRSWQIGATMFVAFGALALVVAVVGLYSVVAYDVAQRRHELGVRVALGAQAGDVLRLVVTQGLRFGSAGVAVGGALAFIAGRWIQPLLFNESARDPTVFAAVTIVLLLASVAASLSPAMRAARADPNVALRMD